jgi:hypothetical protein
MMAWCSAVRTKHGGPEAVGWQGGAVAHGRCGVRDKGYSSCSGGHGLYTER